jgi:hypothetical protein
MGQRTWFDIRGHSYEVDKDGFGMQGVQLTEPGKTLRVEVKRRMAQRLGRLTGGGLFGESQRFDPESGRRESGIRLRQRPERRAS